MARQISLIQVLWGEYRARIIILVLLTVILAGGVLCKQWLVEPKLAALSGEQFQLQQYVRQRQVEFANSGVPVSTVEQMERNLKRFYDLIPPASQFSQFVGELFQWADQADLVIAQINYKPELDEESGFLNYGLSFSVKGRYGQIKKFISLLESSERILLIDSISLNGSSSSRSDDSVSLNIALTTYFQESSS